MHLQYTGFGTARTGGEATDLATDAMDVELCSGLRRTDSEPRQSFGAIDLGPACSIDARREGSSLVGVPGSTCTLRVGGEDRQLRITDATLTFGQAFTRYGRIEDRRSVTAHIGGDEPDGQGGLRHGLYVFTGTLRRNADARDWCNATVHGESSSRPEDLFRATPIPEKGKTSP